MPRSAFVLPVLLLFACPAAAQDMPLSQILIDGEGWKKAPGKPEKAKEELDEPGVQIGVAALSPDRGTLYLWVVGNRFIGAYRPGPDGAPVPGFGGPYCHLRIPEGREKFLVTGLVVDQDGRIYAATPIGVQVFDPTGRLCGVLHPPAQGKPEHLAFEGDRLTVWVGDVKYTRKLNTTGAK